MFLFHFVSCLSSSKYVNGNFDVETGRYFHRVSVNRKYIVFNSVGHFGDWIFLDSSYFHIRPISGKQTFASLCSVNAGTICWNTHVKTLRTSCRFISSPKRCDRIIRIRRVKYKGKKSECEDPNALPTPRLPLITFTYHSCIVLL